jgi:SAM-dependent methyltransferase
MSDSDTPKAPGFSSPTQLPGSAQEAARWQEANQAWWQSHPMRYDWKQELALPEFSREFFGEIDRRFFSAAREFLPWDERPFDPLIDFASLRNQDVLEIGVGNGSHAQLLAQSARTFTGIDITAYAVESASRRLQCFGLPGTILRMDAERMQFADNSFDFVWSWGVIHHSSDTRRVLREIHRVLRPGGRLITMVYHRGWLSYYLGGALRALYLGRWCTLEAVHQAAQRFGDGALARFYSRQDWTALVSEFFQVRRILVLGQKSDMILLPAGRLKDLASKMTPNALARLLLNRARGGGMLVSVLEKPR